MNSQKKSKRILLVTQYFYPENFKSNDIAFELKSRGYEVDMLVGIPNYPEGRYSAGYGIFKKRIETIRGVRVYRAFQTPRGRAAKAVGLAANYLSYALFASVWAFFLGMFRKYDAILVHQTSPITQILPAVVVKKLRKVPLYMWVLDLWPESLTAAGGITNPKILGCVERFVRFAYNQSDRILISSEGFRSSICEKGDYANKIVYFPNWGDSMFETQSNYAIPQLPEGFKIVFTGNLGEAQNLEVILHTALQLKDHPSVRFIFVGDGRKRPWMEEFIAQHALASSVHLMGRFPQEAMSAFFSEADILLVSLKDEPIFNLTVPAKVQAYMAAGKPIIAMINGECQQIIRQAQCGYAVDAGDIESMVRTIKEISQADAASLRSMGENGKNYYKLHFQKDNCINNLCGMMER